MGDKNNCSEVITEIPQTGVASSDIGAGSFLTQSVGSALGVEGLTALMRDDTSPALSWRDDSD